jgi:GntR family transcriptional regulator
MKVLKHVAIFEALKARCVAEPIGTRLPPERLLALEFEVSVITVRQALSSLERDGWVRKFPGSGTFISRPRVSMGPGLSSFTEDMTRRGLHPSSTVMRCERIKPDLELHKILGLRPAEGVILLERLRFADSEPMCHELSMFPDRFAPALMGKDLDGSVHEVLREHGIVGDSTQRVVSTVILTDHEAKLLQLPPGSPALETVDTFFDVKGSPIQHAQSRYRFDRYEARSTIRR